MPDPDACPHEDGATTATAIIVVPSRACDCGGAGLELVRCRRHHRASVRSRLQHWGLGRPRWKLRLSAMIGLHGGGCRAERGRSAVSNRMRGWTVS